MAAVIGALIPIFALIVLGKLFQRLNFPGAAFWPALERLTYFVLFPGLLFHSLAAADFTGAPVGRLVVVLGGMMLVMAAALAVARPLVASNGPAFTSVFQGAVRWNSFVALGAIASLQGPQGLSLVALAIAIMVPLANILSVTALLRWGGERETPAGARLILNQLIRNPLIMACAAGIAVQLLGLKLPAPLLSIADMLGEASLALGLFAVGASLDLEVARGEARAVAISTTLKLIAMPLMAAGLCAALGVTGDARAAALVCAAVPGAASAYILARQLGGDAPLMAGITTAQTLAAMLTMPLMLGLLI